MLPRIIQFLCLRNGYDVPHQIEICSQGRYGGARYPGAIHFIISLEDKGNPAIEAFAQEKGRFQEIPVEYI